MLLDAVLKGTTDYSTTIRIVDSTDGTPETGVVFNTTGIDLWYRRPGAAHSSITEATQTEGGAHTDGGFVHISDGYYRLDLPDAALATGVDYVDVGGTVTGMVVIGGRIRLTDLDLSDGTRGGLTALPNAAADAAGGLPISDAGGLDLDSIKTDTAAILVDTGTTLDTKLNDIQGATFSSATDSLEAIRNRGDSAWTGSPTTSDSGTAQAGSTSTITLQSGASATDDTYNGQVVYISSGTGAGQSRAIGDYVGSTKVATVITNWATAPDNTSVYEIYPDDITEITPAPTVEAIADGIWDESTAGHTGAGTFGEQLKNDVDAILVDTGTTLDTAITNMQADVTAVLADTNELQGDWTDGGRLDLIVDSILADTGELQTDLADGGRLDLLIDSILADTATLGTPAGASHAADVAANLTAIGANLTAINALNDISVADVNAQVLDVLNTDTFAEPTGVPAATATLVNKLGYLYMALRNQIDISATKKTFYDDAGTAEWEKDLSDAAGTYSESEANAI